MRILNDKELKSFIIAFINKKEKESSNRNYIEYSYYELKVKYGLTEEQILLMQNLNGTVKKEKLNQMII